MSKYNIIDSQKSQIEYLAKNAFDTRKSYKHMFVLVEQLPNSIRMSTYHGHVANVICVQCKDGVPPSSTFYKAFLDIIPQFHSIKDGFTFHFFKRVEPMWKLWKFHPELRYAQL